MVLNQRDSHIHNSNHNKTDQHEAALGGKNPWLLAALFCFGFQLSDALSADALLSPQSTRKLHQARKGLSLPLAAPWFWSDNSRPQWALTTPHVAELFCAAAASTMVHSSGLRSLLIMSWTTARGSAPSAGRHAGRQAHI
jgi:hypothetical protein